MSRKGRALFDFAADQKNRLWSIRRARMRKTTRASARISRTHRAKPVRQEANSAFGLPKGTVHCIPASELRVRFPLLVPYFSFLRAAESRSPHVT